MKKVVRKKVNTYNVVYVDNKNQVGSVPVKTYNPERAREAYRDLLLQESKVLYGVRGERGRFVA